MHPTAESVAEERLPLERREELRASGLSSASSDLSSAAEIEFCLQHQRGPDVLVGLLAVINPITNCADNRAVKLLKFTS